MKPIKQTINTIPDGTWEAGQTNESLHSTHKFSPTSDLQKNGYPKGPIDPLPESAIPRKNRTKDD